MLHREVSPDAVLEILNADRTHSNNVPTPTYFASSRDMALGQGANKGVHLEFDAGGFSGEVNTGKPGWEISHQAGQSEFIAQAAPADLLRGLTAVVLPEGQGKVIEGMASDPIARLGGLARALKRLERMGWTRTVAGGEIRYQKPGGRIAPAEPQSRPLAATDKESLTVGPSSRDQGNGQALPEIPAADVLRKMDLTGVRELAAKHGMRRN